MEKANSINSDKLAWIKPQIQTIDFNQTEGGKGLADAGETIVKSPS